MYAIEFDSLKKQETGYNMIVVIDHNDNTNAVFYVIG